MFRDEVIGEASSQQQAVRKELRFWGAESSMQIFNYEGDRTPDPRVAQGASVVLRVMGLKRTPASCFTRRRRITV